MWCPVHFRYGCDCRVARQSPVLVCLAAYALAVTACTALSCSSSPRPSTCSERDAGLLARETECLMRVGHECAEIPADQPCPFEDECKAWVRERCK